MSNIRDFRNADLPELVGVWEAHWSRIGPPPQVSVAVIEQAVLSRTFFPASSLLVGPTEGALQAWCHCFPDPSHDQRGIITAFCFTDQGADLADSMLRAVESAVADSGAKHVLVGTVRDQSLGYAGLPPMGHGIGVPAEDHATTALLNAHGYTPNLQLERLVASTIEYRIPFSRDVLQFRRATEMTEKIVVASDTRRASALSHFDIERHTLVDRLSKAELASIDLWTSDPEAQVMKSSHAILDLSTLEKRDELLPPELYLLGAVLQSLAAKRITSVETAVDVDQTRLIEQLAKLHFDSRQQGASWQKDL